MRNVLSDRVAAWILAGILAVHAVSVAADNGDARLQPGGETLVVLSHPESHSLSTVQLVILTSWSGEAVAHGSVVFTPGVTGGSPVVLIARGATALLDDGRVRVMSLAFDHAESGERIVGLLTSSREDDTAAAGSKLFVGNLSFSTGAFEIDVDVRLAGAAS